MAASNCKHTEWILETIDHLRRRKARPDVERICHVVRRRYGLGAAETEAKLEKLVDAEIVIKVDYKGNTSYRNAAKWRRSMLGCAVLNSTAITVKLLEAILELSRCALSENSGSRTSSTKTNPEEQITSLLDPANLEAASKIGASIENINVWLQQNFEGFVQLKSPLTIILKREIDAGRIKRIGNTNYVITTDQIREISDGIIRPLKLNRKLENKAGLSSAKLQDHSDACGSAIRVPSSNDTSSCSLGKEKAASEGIDSSTVQKHSGQQPQSGHQNGSQQQQPARRGRPPKHRPPQALPTATPGKMAKAASEEGTGMAPTKLKRILTTAADSAIQGPTERKVAKGPQVSGEPRCDLCQQTALYNKKGEPESLLCCKDCTARAHPSCMKYTPLLAGRAYKGPWQCMDCKTCCVCQDAGDSALMLVCDGCDKGYHTNCHQPNVNKKPSGSWECSSCKIETATSRRNEFLSQYGGQHYSNGSAPPTPSESPVSMMNGHGPLPTSPVFSPNGVYPDASGWSVEDVVKYISSAGFTEEAKVFSEQEIDGVALLLLKRVDVLRGLELKLGPALKINRHIQGLQAARDGSLI